MRLKSCTLALMLVAGTAGAESVALFDLRPVHAGGQTDLEALEGAVSVSRQLRTALHAQGFESLPVQNLRLNLGKTYRIKVFECHERMECLRPVLARLARLHVRLAVVGTFRPDTGTVALTSISFAPYAELHRLTLKVQRGSPQLPADAFKTLLARPVVSDKPEAPEAPAAAVSEPPPPPAPGLSDDGGDVVQSLTDESSAAPPPPPTPDRFSLNGWERTEAELGLSRNGYRSGAPDLTSLPYDALVGREQLLMRARFATERKFEASVEGFFGYHVFEQLPALPGKAFNGFNGSTARYAIDAQLRDAYLAFFFPKVDLRFGQQRVGWGRSDIFTPNDVLNAHDLRDPVLAETELTHLATPMVRIDSYLHFGTLQLAYNPFLIPNRVDYFGSNWSLIQPGSPTPLRYVGNLLSTQGDSRAHDTVQSLLSARTSPALDLKEGSVAARFSYTLAQVDVSHSYQYGYDSTPLYSLNPTFAAGLGQLNTSQAPPPALAAAVLASVLAGPPLINATYLRRHHLGTDLVTTVGSFVLRMDLSYDSERAFTRPDLSSTRSPAFQAVGGLEYQTGEVGKSLEIEVSYTHLFSALGEPVLFATRENLAVGAVAQWLFADHLETELRVVLQANPDSFHLRPQLGWKFDPFVVRAGVVWLNGGELGFGGYFKRNRSVYALLKYAF